MGSLKGAGELEWSPIQPAVMDGGCSTAYTACVTVLALRLDDKEQCSQWDMQRI